MSDCFSDFTSRCGGGGISPSLRWRRRRASNRPLLAARLRRTDWCGRNVLRHDLVGVVGRLSGYEGMAVLGAAHYLFRLVVDILSSKYFRSRPLSLLMEGFRGGILRSAVLSCSSSLGEAPSRVMAFMNEGAGIRRRGDALRPPRRLSFSRYAATIWSRSKNLGARST